MVALSLFFLFVFIFSAYAYGATVVLALRQAPVWGPRTTARRSLDPATFALCVVCTIWFVVLAYFESRLLTGAPRGNTLADVFGLLLSYSFPPLIMHTVFNEQDPACGVVPRPWRYTLYAMYGLSVAVATYMVAAIYNVVPRPRPLGAWIGVSVGSLFTLCSVYCIALIARSKRSKGASDRDGGLRRTMIGLFLLMIPLFFALTFLRDQRLVTEALDRTTRTLPIFFLIASVYFENRFEFYDLIVKRATMLVVNLAAIGTFLALTMGALERLPAGATRPWLFAVILLPLAMLLPWLQSRLSAWLDRMWFGREFTPVEAVKHVLSAMQPATDEQALIDAAETRLSEMFRTTVRVVADEEPVRFEVVDEPGSRTLLSEDLALLHSLASVFAYMLENVRLQRRRQEQEQLARELRLQTSRSELKALRAQINPHFLFNALNAIASLIHTDPTRADAAVEQLAEVFRYTLRRSENEWAPLDQELAFAQAYLDVEQARFGRRLSSTIEADAAATRAQVPSMLLHMLVENAVKHGISQVRGAGRIDIQARVDGDMLSLEVSDTGPGLREHGEIKEIREKKSNLGLPDLPDLPVLPEGESFGLRSVRDRLRGHFGERASLEFTRDEARGLTIARVRMPLVRQETAVGQ